MTDKEKFDFNTMIQSLWNGKLPLQQVFWIYYFAIILGLSVLGSVLTPLAIIFGLFKIVWAGFMVKPIWVAADLYKGPQHWALAAKAAAIVIGLAVVGSLLSL
ncbi:MAG: hypothetical protein CO093_11650 [Alphaproteobacteria bacterium CG_4_9_14_3_um_filter_47_13]|nr:MAG: hypothetical protein CO093_11650 [Alphaproteobacteria bacterium CG_4_9_14_3_um_filter_47_13]